MYSRYFIPGQKVQIHTLRDDDLPSRRESINALFSNYELDFFDVTIPQGWPIAEGTPFGEGRPLEIYSQRHGVWLRSTASFCNHLSDKTFRLRMNHDLCLFRHQPQPRVEASIGLRYSAPRGHLPNFHRQWRQQIGKLTSTDIAVTAPTFSHGAVNLSASGIRMPIEFPIKKQDICLLMMTLDQGSAPICTLAETIWTAAGPGNQGIVAGLQFLNILQEDQERIDLFVKQNRPRPSQKPA